jgi:serine/threonine protein phosphatase PrpC
LLASDGLHAVISDGEIAELLRADSLDDGVSALIRAAKQAGAPDNVSAVVVRYQTED